MLSLVSVRVKAWICCHKAWLGEGIIDVWVWKTDGEIHCKLQIAPWWRRWRRGDQTFGNPEARKCYCHQKHSHHQVNIVDTTDKLYSKHVKVTLGRQSWCSPALKQSPIVEPRPPWTHYKFWLIWNNVIMFPVEQFGENSVGHYSLGNNMESRLSPKCLLWRMFPRTIFIIHHHHGYNWPSSESPSDSGRSSDLWIEDAPPEKRLPTPEQWTWIVWMSSPNLKRQ